MLRTVLVGIALAAALAFGAISVTRAPGVTLSPHGVHQVLACSGVGAGSSGC